MPKLLYLPTIIFTVTNQLVYDQRMKRICTSLHHAGFEVVLIGRSFKNCSPLMDELYTQKRLFCPFKKGILMYAFFNIQLFWYLLFTKAQAICAIDLDTVLPCFLVAKTKKIPIVYDAHEWFTQQKEIITRPAVYKFWLSIEKYYVPRIVNGYTVNQYIANTFKTLYGTNYKVIRNVPILTAPTTGHKFNSNTIIYQGAVNEGRSFETLIPAMQYVNAELLIVGEGNFMQQAIALVAKYNLQHKVIFKGNLPPKELVLLTPKAHIGVTLFEATGKNQEYSLANRFFDYMMAGIPQVCVNYPEYAAINQQYGFALLIDDVSVQTIAQALNNLLMDTVLYTSLEYNALHAKQYLNWKAESNTLIHFWNKILR